MTEFSYIAISRTGEKVSGRADAVSREIVLQQLRSMGQLPVEVRQYTSDETGEVAGGKETAPAGLSGRQSVVECYCAAAGCFQHVRIPGCAFSPLNHKPDCFKLRS